MSVRATVYTRPLFEWLRREAYGLQAEFDDYAQFEQELIKLSLDWLEDSGRTTAGTRPDIWPKPDRKKATRQAVNIAEWIWERFKSQPVSQLQ